MKDKINIYVIHYTKLTDRLKYFKKLTTSNLYITFVTENSIVSDIQGQDIINNEVNDIFKFVKAVHLGHMSNLIRSRILANLFLYALSIVISLEVRIFGEKKFLNSRLTGSKIFDHKLREINMMHSKALSTAASNNDICIILEDDSIFDSDTFKDNIDSLKKFMEINSNSIIFFTKPAAKISTVIEDLFQFRKDVIRIIPPMSKGAGAYMLNKELALDLSQYISSSDLALPIDLLISYWAQEKNIRTYWKKYPFVTEGSGYIYKSSLR